MTVSPTEYAIFREGQSHIGARMRVVHVTDTHLPTTNGVVRSIETSRAELVDLGASIQVIAPGTRTMRRGGVTGIRHVPGFESSAYPGFHLAVRPVVPSMLRGADVVHVHTPGPLGLSALVSARRAGIPTVFSWHTRFEDVVAQSVRSTHARSLALAGLGALETAIARRVERFVAPTEAIAEELRGRFDVPVAVVATGVDLARFRPMARETSGGPRFLTLGRVAREKNIEALLRAFPRVLRDLPTARLVVAGDGPDAVRCRATALRLGIGDAVEWLGFVDEDALARTYASADVFVTASRFETQGLTVLEAMASGNAAAVASCAVFLPLVERGAALAFCPDDAESVGRAMVRAYEQRATLGRIALRIARETSVKACARRLLAVYGDVVGGIAISPAVA